MIISLIFNLLLLLLCVALSYKLYKFSILILNIESAVEESLDMLNEKYESIGKILRKDIFFDSVEIRQVIADIKDSQDSILLIANKLTYGSEINSEIKEESNEKEVNQNR